MGTESKPKQNKEYLKQVQVPKKISTTSTLNHIFMGHLKAIYSKELVRIVQ